MNKNLIRIIPKLDIKNGNLIKGINLEGLRILGNPINYSNIYYSHGADELCYLDNVASLYGTNNLLKFVRQTAKNIRIPISVGGGIRSITDIKNMLISGADKVVINSAIVDDINLLKKSVRFFGSSTITALVECIKFNNSYHITKSNGRDLVKLSPFDWCKKLEDNGVGELIVTSVDHEGLRSGFDVKLMRKISKNASIPVIAHGGAGNFEHVLRVIKETSISGVSVASLLHYTYCSYFNFKKKNNIGNYEFLLSKKNNKIKNKNIIKELKKFLKQNKINVR